MFEGLESIGLGLQGKLALFRVLAEIEPHDTRQGCLLCRTLPQIA